MAELPERAAGTGRRWTAGLLALLVFAIAARAYSELTYIDLDPDKVVTAVANVTPRWLKRRASSMIQRS